MDIESLGNFLLDSRLISLADWRVVLGEAGEDYLLAKNLLINKGFLTEDDLRRAEAFLLGLPFVDLKRENISPAVLTLIPEPIVRQYNLVAYQKKGDKLEVAMLDLESLEQIDFLASDYKILPRFTSNDSIRLALQLYQRNLKMTFGDRLKKILLKLKTDAEIEADVVSQLMDLLVEQALSQGASAIHFYITDNQREVVVSYRLGGSLHEAMVLPAKVLEFLLAQFREIKSFGFEQGNQKINCHVSILLTDQGERLLLRLWPRPSFGPALEDFGLTTNLVEKIYGALYSRSGLIIFAGSKQKDNLFFLALLDILNQLNRQVFLISRETKGQVSGITQVSPRPELGQTTAKVLRRVLGQDPDVIALDEPLTKETACLALTGAVSGKLIIAPMLVNSSEEVETRLIDFGLDKKLIERALKLVID